MYGFKQHLVALQNMTSACAVGVNPISRLIQIQQAKKEKEPQFSLVSENGVARSREFVFQVGVIVKRQFVSVVKLASKTVKRKTNHWLKSRETRSQASLKGHWVFCVRARSLSNAITFLI